MQVYESDRRNSRRHMLKTALRLRVWKSYSSEERAESENLSEKGTFFSTDVPLALGSAIEILLSMPSEITGHPTTEWRCTGHVVHLEPVDSPNGRLGVGVQFDCYEVMCSETVAAISI
jgi:hypothetical protein